MYKTHFVAHSRHSPSKVWENTLFPYVLTWPALSCFDSFFYLISRYAIKMKHYPYSALGSKKTSFIKKSTCTFR